MVCQNESKAESTTEMLLWFFEAQAELIDFASFKHEDDLISYADAHTEGATKTTHLYTKEESQE